MTVNPSMDEVFLQRLTQIVGINLGNEQFGVKELAREVGLSRSQLHRKLRSISQQSASQFIREIRLRKAMELLQQEVGTASEIAYRVGFGSPTYFTKCFHDYYGFPPGEVRKAKTGSLLHGKEPVSFNPPPENEKVFQLRKPWLLLIGFLLIVGVAFYLVPMMKGGENYNMTSNEILDKSIAVLPFKNLSEDQVNQYFADGMMEDILNRLARIHDLKVISRVSSDQYRKSTKSLPQIAEELGVAYVLEGSVQMFGDKARIFVQLIEAESDRHLWSQKFDGDCKDVMTLQSSIARQVASELQAVLSPNEMKQMERNQTENMEAYNLYLKGRFFWNRRTEEGQRNSLKYFKQAIALDSTYALAYAGMADAYFILTGYGWYPEERGYAKAREFALKAITLDPNLAEPHATLGAIAKNEWNWKEAEEELTRAIELNGSYATAHQWYAEYLAVQGDLHGAIKEVEKALELNPQSFIMHGMSGWFHFHAGHYSKALERYQTGFEMDTNFLGVQIMFFRIYSKLGRDTVAVDYLKKWFKADSFFKKDSLGEKHIVCIEEAFDEDGIEGVERWFFNWRIMNPRATPYRKAAVHAYLGHKEKALDYLEEAFAIRQKEIAMLKYDHCFKNLRAEPRYKLLLKKMKLSDE